MGAMQRRKGAAGERDAAQNLKFNTGLIVERNARNGVAGAADLVGEGIALEVKRRKRLSFHRFLDQAGKHIKNSRGEIVGCEATLIGVLSREDNGFWHLTIPLWQAWTLWNLMNEQREKTRQRMAQHQQSLQASVPSVPELQPSVQQ
jgi:hypothetical protein